MSEAAIEALLARYLDALHHSDAESMASVLHPAAIYATADEQAPLIRDVPTYLGVLRRRVSPAARGEARTDRIVSIDTAGENTALARVICSIAGRHFTDFLSCIRTDGEWRIIAKVFAIAPESRED